MAAPLARLLGAITRSFTHVGRRGAFLLFLALVDFSTALGLLTLQNNPGVTEATLKNYEGFTRIAPFEVWGVIWFMVGLIALFFAFSKAADRFAFFVCTMIKFAWALGWFLSWGFYGAYRGWVQAVVYLVFGGIVVLVSGWKENHDAPGRAKLNGS